MEGVLKLRRCCRGRGGLMSIDDYMDDVADIDALELGDIGPVRSLSITYVDLEHNKAIARNLMRPTRHGSVRERQVLHVG